MANVTEEFDLSRDIEEELLHGKAWPLPRLTRHEPFADHYEVIVAGAGPAGMFLTLLLARLGLHDGSLLCVDGKAHATNIGHADGIVGRTMEVLASCGLADEVIRRGRCFAESVLWVKVGSELKCIQRGKISFAPCRFDELRTLHQGRLERMMLEDLSRYSKRSVEYGTAVTDVRIDESNAEYPVVVTLGEGEKATEVRTKYLVGADGAHSKVRQSMGIFLEGDVTNRIWGVVDMIPQSDFPDIRRTNTFSHEDMTSAGLIIPRERISNGEYLSRFYVDMTDTKTSNGSVIGTAHSDEARKKRAEFTKEQIIEHVNQWLYPYSVKPKQGTKPYWWATYSVGQRLAKQFIVEDSQQHPRVFLVGDACHTHTPTQGQGLNISMQDSYNLAWKLATSLFGLCPDSTALLQTYEPERRTWAERVVFFDKHWNQLGVDWGQKLLEMRDQVTNCGVQYQPSIITSSKNAAVEIGNRELFSGVLKVGRRLFNTKLMRFIDGDIADIHDDLPMNGRHRVVVLADQTFLSGRSMKAVEALCNMTKRFPHDIVEVIILQQDMEKNFAWTDVPAIVKETAEMRLYCADKEVYETYGVDPKEGALVLVRPDMHVSLTTTLDEFEEVEELLKKVLVPSLAE